MPPEQRGWEWNYLKRLTLGGLFTLPSASFSPDGTRIVTRDRRAKVWDAQAGRALLERNGDKAGGEVVPLRTDGTRFSSPDGTRIFIGAWEPNKPKVWDARMGRPCSNSTATRPT